MPGWALQGYIHVTVGAAVGLGFWGGWRESGLMGEGLEIDKSGREAKRASTSVFACFWWVGVLY
jgi:hypothetical protein